MEHCLFQPPRLGILLELQVLVFLTHTIVLIIVEHTPHPLLAIMVLVLCHIMVILCL